MTALIDAFLSDTKHQSLIDADRVRDLLLDLRSLLAAPLNNGSRPWLPTETVVDADTFEKLLNDGSGSAG